MGYDDPDQNTDNGSDQYQCSTPAPRTITERSITLFTASNKLVLVWVIRLT